MLGVGYFFLLSFFATNDWWTMESEVFHIIGAQHRCMVADSLYVVDHQQLIQFDRNGKRVKVVAHQGEAPQDINRPTSIFSWDDKVHVMGLGHMKIFGPDGFEKAVRLPEKGITLRPVLNGWVYLNQSIFVVDGKHDLRWTDPNFENSKALVTWAETPADQVRKNLLTNEVIRTDIPHNLSFLRVSKDGKTIFFKQTDTKILVFDSLTGVKKRTVEIGSPILRMSIDPYGKLNMLIKGGKETRVIDQEGKRVPATLPFHSLSNLIEIKDGWAYWGFYDFEKDDLILAGCRETVIDKFLQAHTARFKLGLH